MNKLKLFLATLLSFSLLAFAGCGNNNDSNMDDGTGNDTVTEENRDDVTDEKKDSVANDIEKDARDAVDDVENAVDGNGNQTTKSEETKESDVGQ